VSFVGQDPGPEPPANQPDYFGVIDFLGHFPQKAGVAKVIEESLDIELGDPSVTSQVRLANPMHRCLGTLARPIAEAAGQELGFKQRLDHLASGLLNHPIGNRWNT
jgi:hypothetical protein